MKIVTVSDTESGGKPTRYCRTLSHPVVLHSMIDHIRNGIEECGGDPSLYEEEISSAACWVLDSGFGWAGERYLVEVTEVKTEWSDQSKRLTGQLALNGINDGTVRVEARSILHGMEDGWAIKAVRDALAFALK